MNLLRKRNLGSWYTLPGKKKRHDSAVRGIDAVPYGSRAPDFAGASPYHTRKGSQGGHRRLLTTHQIRSMPLVRMAGTVVCTAAGPNPDKGRIEIAPNTAEDTGHTQVPKWVGTG